MKPDENPGKFCCNLKNLPRNASGKSGEKQRNRKKVRKSDEVMEESGAYASNDVAKCPEAFETAKKLLTAGRNVKKIFDGLEDHQQWFPCGSPSLFLPVFSKGL